MTDEEDEFLEELNAIDEKANSVRTVQDFIEFLEMLQTEISEDDEADKRLQLEFFNVVRRNLIYARRFPEMDLDIELPSQPDWGWLARLFLVGSFEN